MILAGVAAFAGAFVQSATGFGFALVLSPALFAALDPVEAVTTLLILGLALNLLVLFERGRPSTWTGTAWGRSWWLPYRDSWWAWWPSRSSRRRHFRWGWGWR